jgi:YVTN family beta-propeller protein
MLTSVRIRLAVASFLVATIALIFVAPSTALASLGTPTTHMVPAVGSSDAVDTAAVPTPDGRYVMVSDYQNDLLYRFDTRDSTWSSAPVIQDPYGVAVTADGTKAVVASFGTGSGAGTGITVVDIASMTTRQIFASAPGSAGLIGVAVSSDGHYAYAAGQYDNSVHVFNLWTNADVAHVTVGSGPNYLVLSSDDTRLYVANTSANSVSVLSVSGASAVLLNTITTPATGLWGIALSTDGSRLAATGQNSDTVCVIDTATLTALGSVSLPSGAAPTGVAFSPDGSQFAVTSNHLNEVQTFDTASLSHLQTVVTPPVVAQQGWGVSYSGDGSNLWVAGSWDSELFQLPLSPALARSTPSVVPSPSSTPSVVPSSSGGSETSTDTAVPVEKFVTGGLPNTGQVLAPMAGAAGGLVVLGLIVVAVALVVRRRTQSGK